MPGPLLGRDPCGSNTSHKRPVSLCILGDRLREVRLYCIPRDSRPSQSLVTISIVKSPCELSLRPRPGIWIFLKSHIFLHESTFHTKPVNPLTETSSFSNRSPEWFRTLSPNSGWRTVWSLKCLNSFGRGHKA